MPGPPPGAATPLHSLPSPFLSRSGERARHGPRSCEPAKSQAGEGRRPVNHRCRPTGVSVAPTSLGGKPGQFCHLQSRRRPGWSGSFALGSSEMSGVPAAKRPTPAARLLQTRSSGRAGPHGVLLGTGHAVSPEMLVLGDSLPPWLLSERLQSDKRGSMAPQIRPSERLGHSWTHSGPP